MQIEIDSALLMTSSVDIKRDVPAFVIECGFVKGGGMYRHRTEIPLGPFEQEDVKGRAVMLAEALEIVAEEFRSFAAGSKYTDVQAAQNE